MKTNHLFTSMLAVSALLVTSCSTSKLAKNNAIQDDVYNTTAQAKEYKEAAPVEQIAQTDQRTDDYYGTSDPYYDMDYSTRINRFYYANPWRTYYDGYYGYSPFGFNNFYSPFYGNGFGWNSGYYNNFYNSYNYWGYYGAPYYNNYWGLYSYNNPYIWGGGFYGGGGYYGAIGGGIRNSANYGPRPSRGSENGINRTNGTSYGSGANGIADRTSSGGSRAERYNPTNGSTGTTTSAGRTNGTTTNSTPTRSTTGDSRPTRSNDAPARSTYNPPAQSSPPPSSSSSGSRGESSSGSSSSGSSSSGGGRPTRGGGR